MMAKEMCIGALGTNSTYLNLRVELGFRIYMLLTWVCWLCKGGGQSLKPRLLVARTLKAKYFLNGSFMDAPLKLKASYCWKSIYAAMKILFLGSQWQVGGINKDLGRSMASNSLPPSPLLI